MTWFKSEDREPKVDSKTTLCIISMLILLLVGFIWFRDNSTRLSATVDRALASQSIDTRVLAYDRETDGQLIGYSDISSVEVDEHGSFNVNVPKELTNLPNVVYLQLCINGDLRFNVDEPDGIEYCNNNLSSDHAYEITSCHRHAKATAKKGFFDQLLNRDQIKLHIDNFCNQVYPSNTAFEKVSETNAKVGELKLEGSTLYIGNQSTSLAGLDGSDTFVVGSDNTDHQTLTLRNNELEISNGNSIDLSSYLDNTNEFEQFDCSDSQVIIYGSDGWACGVIDASDKLTTISISNSTITYTNENGDSVSWDIAELETTTKLTDNGDGTFTHINENGLSTTIDTNSAETVTSISSTVAGNQIAVYTNEAGNNVVINETVTKLTDNGDGTFSYESESGASITIDIAELETTTTVTNALTDGSLIATYTNEDGAAVNIYQSITTLSDNGDGSFSYTAEDGTVTTIDISNLETLTTVTNTVTGNTIATYKNEDGTSADINETITSVAINPTDQTVTYKNEAGINTVIEIKDLETSTTLTNVLTTGKVIGNYINEDGIGIEIKETITSLTNNGDGSFTYTNEDGLSTTFSETTTSLTSSGSKIAYTNEDGTVSLIDIKDLETLTTLSVDPATQTISYTNEDGTTVTANIANLETTTSLTINGQTFSYTNEDGTVTTVDVKDLETATNLVIDSANQTFSYTNEDGTVTTVNIKDLETTTNITNTLATGQVIATHKNEDGVSVDIKETVTALVNNGDNTYTYTSEDGTNTTITDDDTLRDLSCSTSQVAIYNGSIWICEDVSDLETLTSLTDTLTSGHLIGSYIDEDGTSTSIYESITSVVENNDGTFSFTNEDGQTSVVDISNLETTSILSVNTANQDFTYTNEDGQTTTVNIKDLETTTNVTNTLTGGHLVAKYTNEDGVEVSVYESVTTIADNNDGTFTYTNEDGTQTIIDVSNLETLTTLTNVLSSGNTIGSYTNEDGTVTNIKETITKITDNNDGTFTFTDEAGVNTTLDVGDLETITAFSGLSTTGNAIGTYTSEDGTSFEVKETITKVTQNNDGTFSFTDEAGNSSNIDVSDLETLTTLSNVLSSGNTIGSYKNEDGISIDIKESVTSVTQNNDGTFSFTDEAGGTTNVDIKDLETTSTLTNNNDGTFTYTNEDGLSTTFSETLTTVTGTITGKTIATYKNEDGVVVDINETITTTTVDAVAQTITYTSENGTVTTANIKDLETTTNLSVDAANQQFTYTNEDGVAVTLDIADLETTTTISTTGSTITYTNEDGLSTAIDIKDLETLTSLAQNSDGTITYTDEDGQTTTVSAKSFVTGQGDIGVTGSGSQADPYVVSFTETITTLSDVLSSGQVIGKYTNEDGVSVEIKETVTELKNNGDNTYTYTSEDGTTTTITNSDTLRDLNCAVSQIARWDGSNWLCSGDEDTTNFNISDGTNTENVKEGDTVTFSAGSGLEVSVGSTDSVTYQLATNCSDSQLLKWNSTTSSWACADDVDTDTETVTTLVDNSDGTYTYTSENGTVTVITDTLGTLSCATDQVAAWTGSAWSCTDIKDLETLTKIQAIGSVITYTDEDGATTDIDIKALETTTTITSSGSTITYTDEDGATTDIDIKDLETLTTLAQNSDGTITYTDEDGIATTVSAKSFVTGQGDITVTGSGSQADPFVVSFTETTTNITNTIAGNLIGTYTNEDGVTADINETITSMVVNSANQTITYTSENGTTATADIKALETTTTLTDNGDGTYTYTNEDGATSTITDTLQTLSCTASQVATWDDTASSWVCSDNVDTDTLASLSCSDDQTARFDSNSSTWVCAQSSLSRLNCSIDQVAKWGGSNWVCADDLDTDTDTDTLASLSCSSGQIAEYDGSSWVCADKLEVCSYEGQFVISNTASNSGVAALDSPVAGDFYMMYSTEDIRTRWPATTFDAGHTDNIVAVIYDSATGQWQYDNNSNSSGPVDFTPRASDFLFAKLDYVNDTATALPDDSDISGIRTKGSFAGTTVTPNQYNGSSNAGEWDVTATSIDTGYRTFELTADGTYVDAEDSTVTYTEQELVDAGLTPKICGTGSSSDTLSDLNCTAGQYVQYDGAAWACVDSPNGEDFTVEESHLGSYSVTGDANEPNNVLDVTSEREDTGWSNDGNCATFAGSPDKVDIDATIFMDPAISSTYQRIAPQLELLRNGTVIAMSSTGYQRHIINHTGSSNTIAYIDPNPGTDPVYCLRAQQGSDQDDIVNIDLGKFSLDAVTEKEIQAGVGNSAQVTASNTDLVGGVIPDGYNSYQDSDGNSTPTVTMPTAGQYVGQVFTFTHNATQDTTVTTTNTSMTSNLVLNTTNKGAAFIWNGSAWNLITG